MEDFSFRGVICSKEESNTACWGFTENKSNIKRLYFKLPTLQPDEVRIKVLHAGLCHSDCFMADALWFPNAVLPIVPGHEIVAEVEEFGANVKGYKVGDVVAIGTHRVCCRECESCRKGDDQLCTGIKYKATYDPYLGGYSTHMHVKTHFLYHLPPNLPKHKAAPLLCAGATVYSPLRRWGKAGMRCGVIGIGGLGHIAVQVASKMGMHTVAISTSTSKEREARELGAKEFVCSNNEVDMKRIQSTERLDVVINTTLAYDLTQYLYTVKPNGCFIQVGASETSKPIVFNHLDLVGNQKMFVGSAVGNSTEVKDMLNFCSDFGIAPVVESYKWEEFPKAYKRIHDETPRYRCVVDVASTYDNL